MKGTFADHGSRGYYKPFATRPLVLASFLLITLTLIAITEYACRNLPNHAGIGTIGNVINGTLKRDLEAHVKREPAQNKERFETYIPILSYPLSFNSQLSITSTSSSSSSVTTTATGGNLSLGGGSTSLPGGGHMTTSIVSGGWLSPGAGSTATGSTSTPSPPSQASTVEGPASNPASQPTSPPAVQIGGGNTTPSSPNAPIPPAAPSSVAVNPVQQPTNVAVAPSSGAAGTTATPDTTKVAVGAMTSAGSFADTIIGSVATPTPVVVVSDGQTFVDTSTSAPVASDGRPTPVVITSDGQVLTEKPSPNLSPAVVTSDGKVFTESPHDFPTPVVFTSDGQTFTSTPNANPTPIVIVSNGKTFTENPDLQATAQDTSFAPVVFVSDGQTFTETPSPVIFVSSGHTFTSTPTAFPTSPSSTSTSEMRPIATVVNSTGTFLIWSGGQSTIYPQITLSQYILVAFTPLLLAVIYTIPFRILDRTIRELEPFYQLSQPGGALAEHSLCLDYTTSNGLITPFKAGIRGHAFMFWSSLMSLAIVVLTPLSSEALFVSLSNTPGVYGADVDYHSQDYASWGIYPTLARLIEGVLSFIAVLLVFMIWAGRRRESGIYGEPTSIVGLATLFHSSPLLRGFREIDSLVGNTDLKKVLTGQRYRIGEFVTADYRRSYGLLPADSESGLIINAHASRKGPYRLVEGAESREQVSTSITNSETRTEKEKLWERIKEKLLYAGILVLTTGMLTLICYYHWSEGDIHHGFEHFMDSDGFGVKFMMTALGVGLKMFWSNLDQGLRRTAPYIRLAHSPTSPMDSILVPTFTSPFSALPSLLQQKHFLLSTVAILSILSEFLPICLANIAFSAATTETAYETCNDISIIILILMILCVLVLVFRPSTGVKRLPRSPNTVASVLVYLATIGGEGMEREGLLDSVKGMERMETKERDETVEEWERKYALGIDRKGNLRIDEVGRVVKL